MQRIVLFLKHFLLAVQFFTRIPITGALAQWVGYSPAMLRASAAHFAGVGLLVGLVAAAVYAALASLPGVQYNTYGSLIAAALSTVATVMLTGGFHEDGLADLSDGLGGSMERARALEIMKDSRVGAFGAMALVLALLGKVALLAALGSVDVGLACLALVSGHVVSRALPMVLVRFLPHVGDSATSKSKPLADDISAAALWANFAWVFMVFAGVSIAEFAINFIVGSSFALLAMLWLGRLLKRRLQGFTGDALGAVQQVCEIAFYLGALVASGLTLAELSPGA